MKRIGKLAVVALILLAVMLFGGYNWLQFSHSVELRNPDAIFSFLKSEIPSELQANDPLYTGTINGPDPSDTEMTIVTNTDPYFSTTPGASLGNETLPSNTDSNEGPFGSETLESKGLNIEYTRILKIGYGDKVLDLSSTTSAEFVKWLSLNYNNNISLFDDKGNEITGVSTKTGLTFANTEETDTTEPSTENVKTTETTEEESTPSVNPALYGDVTLTYSDTLEDKAHLEVLIADIEVADNLASGSGYNRDDFEKPVKSYILGGIKLNRNNYSWMSSPFFDQKSFTFTCPYTGKVLDDVNDKKPGNGDFDDLDYDHIVPLKSAYIRGANEWTNEQRNAYAYDQWVAVDVLYSANRSKGDKGPLEYLPEKNVEDYCYSWLLICSKYDLKMTQEEIDLCRKYINTALQNGEPVTHLGGHYEAA